MKKLLMVAVLVACVGIASAAESQNIVGYTKVNCPAGQLTLVSLNFETGGLTIDDLLGGQVPDLTVVNLWDKDANAYVTSTKGRSGFSPDAVVNLGDALWIKAPSTTEVVLLGEVLTAGTNTVAVAAGLEATGYYYPVSTLWTDTDLSSQAPDLSVLNVWDGSAYQTFTKGRSGWGTGSDTLVIDPAEGFWIKSPSAFTWDEERPFTP